MLRINPLKAAARHRARCRHNLPHQTAFTLLEMMLTVFLIGLAAGLVAINIGQDNDDIARLEARRFAALVSQLQDESVFIGLPMGIQMDEVNNSYRFWSLEEKWQLVEKDQVLRPRGIPDGIKLIFDSLQKSAASASEDDEEKNSGQSDSNDNNDEDSDAESGAEPKPPSNLLLVEPTGLIRPFIATFRGDRNAYKVSLDNQLNPVLSDEEI